MSTRRCTPRLNSIPAGRHGHWALLVLFSSSVALAAPAPDRAPGTEARLPGWSLSLVAQSGLSLYQSASRTAGGLGGGLGVRVDWRELGFAQADASYLYALGDVLQLRATVGVQAPWTYAPAIGVTLTTLLGQELAFLAPETPALMRHPPTSLGLTLAPLRFRLQGATVSLCSLGLGLGLDPPHLGLGAQLELLGLAVAL